jgi:hypothetical protein
MGGGNVYTLATGARSTQRDTRRSKETANNNCYDFGGRGLIV